MIKRWLLALIFLFSFSECIFAGTWSQDIYGWRYENDDGSFQNSGWFKDIDNKFYYFNAFGYALTNTITPDGALVGDDGAWMLDPNLALLLTEDEDRPNYKIVVDRFKTLYAGTDLPAGDYMVLVMQNSPTGTGHYELGNKKPVQDIIPYGDTFSYNSIVRIYDHEYINAINCEIIPIAMARNLNYKKANMYLGGYNLAPGSYMVETVDESKTGMITYLSIPRDNGYHTKSDTPGWIEDKKFKRYHLLNIKNGQYVKLYNCRIVK
jgi:hypothetical protein